MKRKWKFASCKCKIVSDGNQIVLFVLRLSNGNWKCLFSLHERRETFLGSLLESSARNLTGNVQFDFINRNEREKNPQKFKKCQISVPECPRDLFFQSYWFIVEGFLVVRNISAVTTSKKPCRHVALACNNPGIALNWKWAKHVDKVIIAA